MITDIYKYLIFLINNEGRPRADRLGFVSHSLSRVLVIFFKSLRVCVRCDC